MSYEESIKKTKQGFEDSFKADTYYNKQTKDENHLEQIMNCLEVKEGMRFPFDDNSFDMVITRYSLHHFPAIEDTFGEISRVLKENGIFFLSDPAPNDDDVSRFVDEYMQMKKDGHIQFYTKQEWQKLGSAVGLNYVDGFETTIRFPRKRETSLEFDDIVKRHDEAIIKGYGVEIIDDEIWITEKVNNLLFQKEMCAVKSISMNNDIENVRQAKDSFNNVLGNKTYANIIRDDKHLVVLLDLVKNGNYRRILDIGTGTGYLAFPLAEEFPESKVYGIDIAENIISKNMECVREKGITNLTFQAFDGLKYPFDDESFDLVVTRYAFHHFPNVQNAINQINKLLVKGGRVLISDPMRNEKDTNRVIDDFMRVKKDGHIHFYSQKEIDELFVNNGFVKENQVITEMKFPFPPKNEYVDLHERTTESDRALYDIVNENGVVWVKHIEVGNTIYMKK